MTTAKPLRLDANEPMRVAEAARSMGLRHVVIASVARDDLADGDFNDRDASLITVLERHPPRV